MSRAALAKKFRFYLRCTDPQGVKLDFAQTNDVTPATDERVFILIAALMVKIMGIEKRAGKQHYYVQRHASGAVGNSVLWWEANGNGYVCDIGNAKLWTAEESAALIKRDLGTKYTRWREDEVELIAERHVNVQAFDLIEKVDV